MFESTHRTMPPKLRAVVNAVTFARALSSRKGRDGVVRTAVGVRNAGIQKARNNAGAGSARPTATQQLARLDDRKAPEAVTEIPEKWGGVQKLLEHWIGPAGVVYLVKCQKKVEWATEWALLQVPPWSHPRGKLMVALVSSHTCHQSRVASVGD